MSFLITAISIVLAYLFLVLLTEALIWRIQPEMEGGVTLGVVDAGGDRVSRRLYCHEFGGSLYVSSNHWFRKWYHLALEHPEVEMEKDGMTETYQAVAVIGDEHRRVLNSYNMGFVLRLLCGFAPSRFLRLEPKARSQ